MHMLKLLLTPGLGPTLIRRCLESFGSAKQVLEEADARAISAIPGISITKARSFLKHWESDEPVQRELELVHKHGVRLLSIEDAGYPKLLKWINDPPPVLYVRGQMIDEDALSLAIVGARKCSRYGREMAERFAAGCSQMGLTIVSGGAYGIDTASHQAALRVKGRTIAVIGNGLCNPYPSANAAMFDQIATSGAFGTSGASGGAVISEFPMNTSPRPENFPARNRIISGLSLGTLVIEAANRSGALITARLAVEDHGREVMAVPGPVDSLMSEGCHRIIREGWATLVTKPAQVLENLGEAGQLLKASADEADTNQSDKPVSVLAATLSDSQQTILEAMAGDLAIDELGRLTNLPMPVIQADLTLLEIRGLISRSAGKYAKKR